ncbi:phosphoenolpyruvate--protein phosphotransferase [Planctomycetota bacterium]
MEIMRGLPASPGYVVGKARLLDTEEVLPKKRFIEESEIESEIARFRRAIETSKEDVARSQGKFRDRAGRDVQPIFSSHIMMLDDQTMRDDVERRIRQFRFTAEFAVYRVMRRFMRLLREMEDEYFSHRIVDLQDVEKRIFRHLVGEKMEELHNIEDEVILVAADLTPSQTAELDTKKVLGFATDAGGKTSHTAIIARSLNVPAVVGLETATTDISSGDTIIIDGTQGIVFVNPDEDTQKKYTAMRKNLKMAMDKLTDLRDLPAVTTDGVKITLLANAEFPGDVKTAVENGAEGVGLYRTEFLYVTNRDPSEQDHLNTYQETLQLLAGRPINIRTLDLGADKLSAETGLPEKNPFLGCRSIRYCLEKPELFKRQLRAILKASALGDVRLLFPMISAHEELIEAKAAVEEVKKDLDVAGQQYNRDIKVGIMVEVPSIAWTADIIAKDVDFMSVGTNDLIQYMLAVDRTNERVAHLYNPSHPAVVRTIKHVIDAAKTHNVPVAVCGEMSSEVEYTVLLLGMGLIEFSVNPSALPEIKKIVRSVSIAQAQDLAARVLTFTEARESAEFLSTEAKRIIPEVF